MDQAAIKMRERMTVHGGIMLDLGCGERKQENFIGMDRRDLPNVDIVHDVEDFPWPLEDECCLTVVASHLYEHIKPWLSLGFMDEIWRIMKPRGQVAISCPYGINQYFLQDPTHCNPVNEATWQYFDPTYPLWTIYKTKPWEIEKGFPQYQANGMIEVLMRKVIEPIEEYMERRKEELS